MYMNIIHYINHIKYFLTFFIGQAFNIWGQFFTLKYKNISIVFQTFISNSNFQLGNLVLLLNGAITFLLLYIFSISNKK